MSKHMYVLRRGDELIGVANDLAIAKATSGVTVWDHSEWNTWTSPNGLTINREEWVAVRERISAWPIGN